MNHLKILFTTLLTFFISLPTYAYLSTMDTGDVLAQKKYKVHLETQFITSNHSGIGLNGRFDVGLTEESGFRGLIGVGAVGFHVGGFYKWSPIPDTDQQPAVGFLAGVSYASLSGLNDLSLRFHPIVSKKFEIELGEITPYGSLPMGIHSNHKGEKSLPLQLTVGVELKTLHWEKVIFMAEINFDIQETFSYFSLGASVFFDEEGIKFE